MDFNLRDRTALIHGPFSSTVQSLTMGLTQLGANCVLLDTDDASSKRFCNQINDSREVNPQLGRALGVKNPLNTEADFKEAIGSVAHTFGGVDLFIDAQLVNFANRFIIGEPIDYFDDEILRNFKSSVILSHSVLSFLKSRKRGRILYLMNENYPDPIVAGARGALISFAQALAKQVVEHNITVNILSLGLTEEWILQQFPEATSIKEAVEMMKKNDPSLKITEPDKVTNAVAFLLSQAGIAVNGQQIKLT